MDRDWYTAYFESPHALPESVRRDTGGAKFLDILKMYRKHEQGSFSDLYKQQQVLLGLLAKHCAQQSPYFAKRLQVAKLKPEQLTESSAFSCLTPMTRQHWMKAGKDLYCKSIPADHGKARISSTTGSTGEPVVTRTTQFWQTHWMAYSLREHLWHFRDPSGSLAVIRANVFKTVRSENRGTPLNLIFASGPAEVKPATESLEDLVDWLCDFQPQEILCLPSILTAIFAQLEATHRTFFSLKTVRTLSETVTEQLRTDTRRLFNSEVADIYSSQECGVIATQCPEYGNYHVTDTILLEVITPDGTPCGPGEIGKVVVTDLLNYATPVIRYEIGDYAEAGDFCPCGRSSPTVKRLVGRERNLITLPDGSKHWPLVGFRLWNEVLPIRQFQFIQKDRQTIHARFYVSETPNPEQEAKLTAILRTALGYDFTIQFEWCLHPLLRSKSGKFEEFISHAT